MATITFDTHKFVRTLEEAGFDERQAEAVLKAQREAFAEVLETTLATRDDTSRIESELRLHRWMLTAIIGGIAALILKTFF